MRTICRIFGRCAVAAILAAAFEVVLVIDTVQAQTGDDGLRFAERSPGLTAQNIGMGGVGYAGTTDGASLILNPAGLALADRSALSGSVSLNHTRDRSDYRVAGLSSTSSTDVSQLTFGDLSYIYKAPTSQGSLVFGAAFHQINSWERDLEFGGENPVNSITDFFMPVAGEFELFEDEDGIFPDFSRTLSFIAFETFAIDFDRDLFDQGADIPFLPAVRAGTVSQVSRVKESGTMREFNFGVAYEASEGVFVGASVNIPYGTYKFERVFDEDDIFDDNNGENGTTDFDYLTYADGFESDIIGINARFGVIGYVSPTIRLGANVETPTSMSIEESFFSTLETSFDNGDTFFFGGGIDDPGQGEFEYTLTTPWRIGVGAAYEGPNLTVMLDLEWIDWSTMRFSSSSTSFADVNDRIEDQLETVVNGRLGAQYKINQLFLRAGLGYSPDPHRNRAGSASIPSVDEERGYVSFGLGYRFSDTIQADIGWMGERYDDIYQPYSEVDGAPIVDEEITRGRVVVGLTVLF